MSKLFKLKEWLTLEEAANHISNVLGDTVTLADIYRLALDKHLMLSANFVNGAWARIGKFVKTEDIEFVEFDKMPLTEEKLDNPLSIPLNAEIQCSKDDWIALDEKVVSIRGLWDLTMMGAEQIDIEFYYQQETSGLEVTLQALDGVFLQQGDVLGQLQTDFDDNEYQLGSKAQLNVLKGTIAKDNLSKEDAEKELKTFEGIRKKYLEKRDKNKPEENYFPSGGLDEHDYVLVVKTNEVTRFIQSLEDTPPEAKPLTSKERNSLLVLLGAVCKNSDIDPSQRGIATSLVAMTELIGAPLTDDTIRKILNQIEPAIESRSK
ncbi:hypothetical protein [Colwellia sp. UCD-KL20]|uniref:hypothetical protein n=1 Tax=Colwellia sp. UCD-KL20 TaxID=1917165 RepID=UPI00097141AB|nr:hypothetical protein [Colwellia sp. UCD-KL20]